MTKPKYDPQKAHDYYERTKKLKGRKSGSGPPPGKSSGPPRPASGGEKKLTSAGEAARQRVIRLQAAVSKLQTALSEARAALSKKRASAKKTAKENSDGKSSTSEKTASKKYRDKHKTEIANKRKQASPSSGSGSSSSSTSSVSDMSVTELETRVINIQNALTDAKRQLSAAQQQLGQLAHSAITSEPEFQDQFARYLSAERRPSA